MIANAVASAVANLVLLVFVPFLLYWIWHRGRAKRSVGEVAERAGLRLGETRYLVYAAAFAAVSVVVLLLWPPPLETSLAEGSSFRVFEGLGLGPTAVGLALLYGVVQTGFAEEFFFRGLIAGSLARRLPFPWANLLQALVFLAPHLLLLTVAPEAWGLLPLIFAAALVLGWLRIRSGSILGPWIVHAAGNVAMALSVAVRSAG